MPGLPAQKIETLRLPSSKDEDPAEVTLDLTLTARHAAMIGGRESSLVLVADLIQSWNFTDASGAPVPVSLDSVRRLGITDFNAIMEKVNEALQITYTTPAVGTDEKKD